MSNAAALTKHSHLNIATLFAAGHLHSIRSKHFNIKIIYVIKIFRIAKLSKGTKMTFEHVVVTGIKYLVEFLDNNNRMLIQSKIKNLLRLNSNNPGVRYINFPVYQCLNT